MIGGNMLGKLLEYQKVESELINAQNELAKSTDKEKALTVQQSLKNYQAKLVSLEKSAQKVNSAYEKATAKYEEYVKKLEDLEKELEQVDDSKINLFEKAYKDFFSIANSLEKDIAAMYTEVQQINREYDETIKKSVSERAKFDKYRAAYGKLKAEKEPKIEELKAKLADMKKDIDSKLLAKYSQKREGKIFPVFVALADNKCGGCRMEISASKLSAMKTNDYGVIECENCGRYIFKK